MGALESFGIRSAWIQRISIENSGGPADSQGPPSSSTGGISPPSGVPVPTSSAANFLNARHHRLVDPLSMPAPGSGLFLAGGGGGCILLHSRTHEERPLALLHAPIAPRACCIVPRRSMPRCESKHRTRIREAGSFTSVIRDSVQLGSFEGAIFWADEPDRTGPRVERLTAQPTWERGPDSPPQMSSD